MTASMKTALFNLIFIKQSAYRIQGGIIYNECTGRKLRKKHGETYN